MGREFIRGQRLLVILLPSAAANPLNTVQPSAGGRGGGGRRVNLCAGLRSSGCVTCFLKSDEKTCNLP